MRSPMKRNRHNPEQITRKVRTADQLLNQGQTVADICHALEVSAAPYHPRQQLYGGMKATEAKHLKEAGAGEQSAQAIARRCRSR